VGGAGENDFHFTSWQLYDDLSYTRGTHMVQFGISLERIESNEDGNSNPNGPFYVWFFVSVPHESTSKLQLNDPWSGNPAVRNDVTGYYCRITTQSAHDHSGATRHPPAPVAASCSVYWGRHRVNRSDALFGFPNKYTDSDPVLSFELILLLG
jgi:hypothetical protein